MKDNIISFTKIDIAQIKIGKEIKHELPTNDFLQRLKTAIENDVSKHYVTYNKENGTYNIFHNGKQYMAYYGDQLIDRNCDQIDLIQELNSLVELSNKQELNQDVKISAKEVKAKPLEEIIKDGDEGVFDTEDDKVKYVKYSKNMISKESIFKGISEVFTKSFRFNMEENPLQTALSMIIDATIIAFSIHSSNFNGLLGLGAGVGFLDAVSGLFTGYNLTNISLKLIYRTIKAMVLTAINGITKAIKKRRIKMIENSIVESELSESMSKKAPIKQNKMDTKTDDKPLKIEVKESIRKIFAKFALIKDEEVKKEYATRLNDIIEMCKELPDVDYNTKYSKLVYMLSFLDGEVSETLRNELATQSLNMDFEKTREEVDSISSYKSRKGK